MAYKSTASIWEIYFHNDRLASWVLHYALFSNIFLTPEICDLLKEYSSTYYKAKARIDLLRKFYTGRIHC